MTTDVRPGSVPAIEADIAARRERLANTLDELTGRLTPQAIVAQQKQSAKAAFATATRNEDGSLRMERIAAVAAGAIAFVALGIVRRRLRRNRG